jgi:hypothetical protein
MGWSTMTSLSGYLFPGVWGTRSHDIFAVGWSETIPYFFAQAPRIYLPLALKNHAP